MVEWAGKPGRANNSNCRTCSPFELEGCLALASGAHQRGTDRPSLQILDIGSVGQVDGKASLRADHAAFGLGQGNPRAVGRLEKNVAQRG